MARKMTLKQLIQGTQKVLPNSLEPGAGKFKDMRVVNSAELRKKACKAFVAGSQGEVYEPYIEFYDLQSPETSTPTVGGTPVKVRCSCHSFYFYAMQANLKVGVLAGGDTVKRGMNQMKTGKRADYKRKTPPPEQGGRPHANPSNIPCLCKHLIQLTNELARRKVIGR